VCSNFGIYATKYKYLKIAKVLLNSNANVNEKNTASGLNALLIAVKNKNKTFVKLLLQNDADPNIQDNTGTTALFNALENGNISLSKLLLEKGANASGLEQDSILQALNRGHFRMANRLFENGVQVHADGETGEDILFCAIRQGCNKLALALIERGVSVNSRKSNNLTVLMVAAKYGLAEIVTALIENKANLNATTIADRATALMYTARYGRTSISKILIEKGANLNIATQSTQETALTFAIAQKPLYNVETFVPEKNRLEIVKALLEKGAHVNSSNVNHRTALMIAAKNGSLEIVKTLIEFGADVHGKNIKGRSAIDRSSRKKNDLITLYLLQFGAGKNEDRFFLPLWKVKQRIKKWNTRISEIASLLFPDDTPVIAQIIAEFAFGVHHLQNYIKKNN
jgi:ankyrin repeat protein